MENAKHIKGVELKNGDFVEAEKRLERKLALYSSQLFAMLKRKKPLVLQI